MGFNLPVLNRRRRLLGTATFSPSALFALAEPGVWYDPSDVANLAWRRNLLTFTEQFDNAAWTKTNSSITANAVSAPDGTTTADKLVENTANSTHTASQAFTTSASTSYTFTVYAKADTRSHLDLSALTGFTTNPIVRFTLSGSGASSVRQGSPTPTHSIQSVGDGWYRCQINVTTVAGGSSTFQVALAVDASSSNFYTGDGTSGLFLWGAQLELGSVATDYQRITDVNTEVIERFPTATLFTDTAGTTPVTTPGQTVALALDKSRGLVLGPELVTNGDFSGGSTGWIAETGWSISGGAASNNGTAATNSLYQSAITLTSGVSYRVTVTVTRTAGALLLRPNRVAGGGQFQIIASGTYSVVLVGTGGTFGLVSGEFGGFFFTGTVDNISVRELPGFHATQATLASRPTYGIVPLGGRRNLLTRTEEFDNAAWSKTSVTVTPNDTAAPDGTMTADKVVFAGGTSEIFQAAGAGGTGALAAVGSVWVKGTAGETIQIYDAYTLRTPTVLTGAWQRLSVPVLGAVRYLDISAGNGSTARTIWLWGAQLETGSSATAYQRVGSAYDVTEAGVASLSYLFFDGVANFMVTPTITPGIDKAQVFAGVRKLTDPSFAVIAETSASFNSNAGSLLLFTNTGLNGFVSRGSLSSVTGATISATAPVTSVLTGLGDIAADVSNVRQNGIAGTAGTGDQGTGNYLAYPMYIGRRGGTLNPINMNLFSLIVRFGANLDAATISNTEVWVGGKTQDMFAPVITGVPTIGVA